MVGSQSVPPAHPRDSTNVKPPAKAKSSDELKVKSLKFAWFLAHLACLLASIQYTLSFITFNWSSTVLVVCYRLIMLSSVSAYSIIVYKTYKPSEHNEAMVNESFHYWGQCPDSSLASSLRSGHCINFFSSNDLHLACVAPKSACSFPARDIFV